MKSKSKLNIGIIKSFYRALSNGDLVDARSVLPPEIEWTEPCAEGLPFGGTHKGKEAVFKDVIDVIYDYIREFEIKPKKFFAVGDLVFVLGYSTGLGKITDLKLKAPTAHLWTLRNGTAVKFQAFHDVPAWQFALGLMSAEPEKLAA